MGWRGSAQSFEGVIRPLIGGALGGISWRLLFAPVFMLAGLKGVFPGGAGIGAVWFSILLRIRILENGKMNLFFELFG